MWRAQHFFTLPGDTRPADEVLALAHAQAEYYQAAAGTGNDLAYTVYVDMANARLGLVLSNRAVAFLKSVGKLPADFANAALFDLREAAQAAAARTQPTQSQVAQALLALPTVLSDAQDKAASALAARVSTNDLTASIMGRVVAELLPHIDLQQVFNDAVNGAISVATSEENLLNIGVRASNAVTGKLFDVVVERLSGRIDALAAALQAGARVQVLVDGQPLEVMP